MDVDIEYFFEDMDRATAKASPAQISPGEAKKLAKVSGRSEDPLHKRETLELVRAYYKISEPKIRNHVRKLITAAAASGGSD